MTDMTDTHCQLSVCVRCHRDVSRLAGSAGLAGGGWADIANLAGSGGVLVPASSQPTTHHTTLQPGIIRKQGLPGAGAHSPVSRVLVCP